MIFFFKHVNLSSLVIWINRNIVDVNLYFFVPEVKMAYKMFSLNLNCVLWDHKCFLVLHAYHVLLETVFVHFVLSPIYFLH